MFATTIRTHYSTLFDTKPVGAAGDAAYEAWWDTVSSAARHSSSILTSIGSNARKDT